MSEPKPTITQDDGIAVGLRYFEDHWYRWSSATGAYTLCDDRAAVEAARAITIVLGGVPFAAVLSAALNTDGGSHAVH